MSKIILLVDDSRVARLMTRKIVEAAHPDWKILEACCGEEALESAAVTPPDFIVLDLNMPGIGGMETAKRMKEVASSAKITMLTANIQEPIRQQAEDLGVGFMSKPLREEALLAFLGDLKAP